jgi:hypothetical protein
MLHSRPFKLPRRYWLNPQCSWCCWEVRKSFWRTLTWTEILLLPSCCVFSDIITHSEVQIKLIKLIGPLLWSSFQTGYRNCTVLPVRYELNLYTCYAEESRPPLWYSGQSSWLHNGDVLCFLSGTNWIYICSVEEIRPPLCLVVRVPDYRSRGPGSIPGATRFSEK